jgi:hypothetical protein
MDQTGWEEIGTPPMALRPAGSVVGNLDFQDTMPPPPEDIVDAEARRLLHTLDAEVDGLEVLPPALGGDEQDGYSLVVQARRWTPAMADISERFEPDLRRALLPTGIRLTVVFWRAMDSDS